MFLHSVPYKRLNITLLSSTIFFVSKSIFTFFNTLILYTEIHLKDICYHFNATLEFYVSLPIVVPNSRIDDTYIWSFKISNLIEKPKILLYVCKCLIIRVCLCGIYGSTVTRLSHLMNRNARIETFTFTFIYMCSEMREYIEWMQQCVCYVYNW